jgi:hypothetical protein
MKNILIVLVFIISSIGICQHFQPVYTGNPYMPMNIYVTEASHPTDTSKYLNAGDEIGIFDGNVCVGAKVLTGPIVQGSPLALVASADDPTTPNIDGFITGNIIKYKIWMSQLNIEIPSDSIIPTYSFGNNTFSTLGTSVAVLNAGLIPVELTSFSASVRSGNEVYLEWVTSTETNNSGFAVERRIDAGWSEIGFVKGNGTTTKIHQYHLVDKLMHKNNNYVIKYRLKQIDYNGEFRYSDEIEIKISNTVTGYSLSNNYPNPFNPSTRISYAIPIVSFVTLKIYDVIGNEVATLVNENKEAGLYELTFEAGKLSNGVYFYELKANEFRMVKKLVLMK